ncbi:class I SAM-dependent RNA methyltransferase [Saccharopolyspora phatthalungensis]|uniref:tRNA/tmRNA/rRNA uracil-C5-methylase (TrmA/RlmC/RlmD family) n=1 Tax=Saccharopolyspora phatthalungensis TaxID=664693 RepID=A0A840QCH0_9PSEU|nr:TRAM domain-containing protein [Saccharopolyspora phatthalungensis]MBB5156318.1 tRNA/tmRNA/rRNA uracil-C5-methylase (TrmA/RlmC/RlmD family) [Saccharopolyspora phatthalungensis]
MIERPDWTGRRLEVEIGPVAHGGHCVARYEGRVVFVRHALPGEVVVAEVTEDAGGGFCRADAVEVLTAAAGRVSPPCPLAELALGRDRCGGCDWQHASGETQRELKAAVIAEQLQRIAGIEWPVRVRELPGGLLRWRSRARLAVDRKGRAGFRAHRSHRVIPVDDCPITVEGALDEVTNRRWRPGAELTVAIDSVREVHVTAVDHKPQRRRGRAVARQVHGSGVAHETAAGRPFEVAVQGFWQVHKAAPDTFTEVVARLAATPPGGVAWDLYGGVGLFAAVLAEQVGPAGSVVLVESSKRAVEDAVANLRDLPQVSYRAGTVEDVATDEGLPAPDVVVLDPPRKGAGRAVVDAVTARRPARIVHVACDPAALARDVGLFAERGYRMTELEAFDAFPMTHHIECIALLERAG